MKIVSSIRTISFNMFTITIIISIIIKVKFCPMLAILCIGTRMRALYISHNKGSPQCWAQDSMYLSTSALATQLAVVLIACTLTRKISVDESGSPSSSEITYVPGKALRQ